MDPRSDAELLGIVEAFVVRARRVLAHSLTKDESELTFLADGAWLGTKRDGKVELARRLPSEEAVESLAARVRPLTLHDDGIRYDVVLKALAAYLSRHGAAAEDIAWCRELRADWKAVDPKGGATTYLVSSTVEGGAQPSEQLSDSELALTWFYGDLVHADPKRIDAGKRFGIDQRYAAAAVRTAQLALLTRDTLSFIRHLADVGSLPLSDDALEKVEVQVTSKSLPLSGGFIGERGAKAGMAGEPLGDGWQPMDEAWPVEEGKTVALRIPWGRAD
jgi:hypothetical protein